MTQGKKLCNYLRDVRKEIADANEIDYSPTPCTHEGECLGTCPKCEEEVRYIERGLRLRRLAGKAITIVGLSAAMTTFTGCFQRTAGAVADPPKPTGTDVTMQLQGDVAYFDSSEMAQLDSLKRANKAAKAEGQCDADKQKQAKKTK